MFLATYENRTEWDQSPGTKVNHFGEFWLAILTVKTYLS